MSTTEEIKTKESNDKIFVLDDCSNGNKDCKKTLIDKIMERYKITWQKKATIKS